LPPLGSLPYLTDLTEKGIDRCERRPYLLGRGYYLSL
jgi:hypothetical protein